MNDDLIKRLHRYAPDSLDGNLRGPALEAAAALSEARATIARLEAALRSSKDAMKAARDVIVSKREHAMLTAALDEARAALSPREGEG